MMWFTVSAGSASVAFFILGNYVMAGFTALSVVRNICFIWLEYRGAKASKKLNIALLALFIAIATVTIFFTYQWWVDGALYAVTVFKIFAYWMKGTRGAHLIRLSQFPAVALGIIKHITFLDIMAIVLEAVMFISASIYFARLYINKRKNKRKNKPTENTVVTELQVNEERRVA